MFYEMHCSINTPTLPNAIDAIKQTGPIPFSYLHSSDQPSLLNGGMALGMLYGAFLTGPIASMLQNERRPSIHVCWKSPLEWVEDTVSIQKRTEFDRTHLSPKSVGLITFGVTTILPAILCYLTQIPDYSFSREQASLLNLVLKHQQPDLLKNALLIHYALFDNTQEKVINELCDLSKTLTCYQQRYERTERTCYSNLVAIIKTNIEQVNRVILFFKTNPFRTLNI